jgi:hypothetical protein
VLIYESTKPMRLDDLEDRLTVAFLSLREALAQDEDVVLVLDDEDLRGVGDTVAAAYAHGLLGLCRALASEGIRHGWSIAAVAAPADAKPSDRARWITELGKAGGVHGGLLRLGSEHLGRIPT